MATAPRDAIYQFLSTDGAGGGTINANGDYSSTPTRFYIQPPQGEEWTILRMIGEIRDTNGFSAEEYGNLGAALTNGLDVRLVNPSGTIATLAETLKYNAEWAAKCYDCDIKTWGTGQEILVFRWTFERDVPGGIVLNGDDGEALEIMMRDNLTGLLEHEFHVRGYNSGALLGTGGRNTGGSRLTLPTPL